MSYVYVDGADPRHSTLQKGFNLRWPPTAEAGAAAIYVCRTADDVIAASRDALAKGCRITVRSGGHCYEGFVANRLPDDHGRPLAIIDLGLMSGFDIDDRGQIASPFDAAGAPRYRVRVAAGRQNWDGYVGLYKTMGKTLPGGSCYSVGAGGHIVGGGYGLLSRLHGLTVDWLTGVDILAPAAGGALGAKHVHSGSTDPADRALFIACRGGGGGNFGVILNYYFNALPNAPRTAYWLTLAYDWSHFTQASFGRFLQTYWDWFSRNDANWNAANPALANGGLFTLLKLQHRSAGPIVLAIQYTGKDGTVGGPEDAPFIDFVDTMNAAANRLPVVWDRFVAPNLPALGHPLAGLRIAHAARSALKMDWLYLTQTINTSGANRRGKYKSAYQIGNFGETEVDALWRYLNGADDPRLSQTLVQIDSYGGCVNANDESANPTSVYQRRSLLKSQYQTYWTNPADDAFHVEWLHDLFSAVHADQGGKPYRDASGRYEGCYINYPDIDMKYLGSDPAQIDPRWLDLYYGEKAASLIATKRSVDPSNLFMHEMSIPLTPPLG
ncbi:BBE domain-containing protein [Burkholderia pseudomallei]|uniref:BBE domain-containing protein n=1 Tax=Burkholderia pseudomallei TaxID=28450 RepID=UPI00016B18A8|nr:BBE domain-containing protein [Burkholderia pseudomallei]AIP52817.1 berberine and berberine like family protein [Burkholderia pseudomallei HBPUB10134a]AJX37901.1 berberine and berberine like family protein [Burkholderia pseudomallei]MBD2978475.1 FAD-binding oxidoreductase [Burkholderia pseudomallei]MBD3011944.1 FAD-binding oxidoreductase [Burkholderia pseudomallei]MBF3550160.1 FAD-binding oxidoreductase [Burkholderia pseudomallei]